MLVERQYWVIPTSFVAGCFYSVLQLALFVPGPCRPVLLIAQLLHEHLAGVAREPEADPPARVLAALGGLEVRAPADQREVHWRRETRHAPGRAGVTSEARATRFAAYGADKVWR